MDEKLVPVTRSEKGGKCRGKGIAIASLGMAAWTVGFLGWQYLCGAAEGIDSSSLYIHLPSEDLALTILRPDIERISLCAATLLLCLIVRWRLRGDSERGRVFLRVIFYIWLYFLVFALAGMLDTITFLACSPK